MADTKPANQNMELTHLMIRSLLYKDCALAKEIAEKRGINFFEMVRGEVSKAQYTKEPWSYEKLSALRKAILACGLDKFHVVYGYTMVRSVFDFLVVLFPEVLVQSTLERDDLARWLVEEDHVWLTNCRQLQEIWTTILPHVLKYLNQSYLDKSYENLGKIMERLELGRDRKILEQLDTGVINQFALYELVCTIQNNRSSKKIDILTDLLGKNQLDLLKAEAIVEVVRNGHPMLAAGFAKDNNLPLATWAATNGYLLCVENRQWSEAALISEQFAIPDTKGAAKKELCRLCQRDHDAAWRWALRFDLTLPEATADCCDVQMGQDLIDLVKVGAVKTAIAKRQKILALDWQDDVIWRFYHSFIDPNGGISQHEAICDFAMEAACIVKLTEIKKFLERVKQEFPDLYPQVVEQAYRKMLAGYRKGAMLEIVALVGEQDEDRLPVLARAAAMDLAKMGDWRRFFKICQEWGLNDLLQEVAECEKAVNSGLADDQLAAGILSIDLHHKLTT